MGFYKSILLFLFTGFSIVMNAQLSEASFKLLKEEIQKGKKSNFSFNTLNELLKSIEQAKNDTVSTTAPEFLIPLYETGVNSQDLLVRRFSADVLVTSIGKNPLLTRNSVNRLEKFKKSDFSETAKYNLKKAFADLTTNIGETAKLIAFVCGVDCVDDLQNVLIKQSVSKRDKKDIKLALIRAGQTGNEQKLLTSAKAQVVNDDFVYNLVNDLTYTRSKVVFDYLLEIINRDTKSCTSANNDNPEPMICAYRLIEKVAPCIVNFPAKVNSYGELETKDYKKLLSDVREWIGKNKDTYILNGQEF